jgi:diguanylate cyclase (GGDEF)-like protein/PAS domain S-box-containing protein
LQHAESQLAWAGQKMSGSTPTVGLDIDGHLVRSAFGRLPLTMALTVVVPLLYLIFWSPFIPLRLLIIWCLCCWVCNAGNWVMWRRYRRALLAPRRPDPAYWRRWFVLQSVAAGLAWSLGATLLLQNMKGELLPLFNGLLIAVGAISISLMSPLPRAVYAFLLALYLPPAVMAGVASVDMIRVVSLPLLCAMAVMSAIAYGAGRVTRELVTTQARLRTILDTSLDAVISFDASKRITDWSTRAQALFGHTRDEALGKPFHETVFAGSSPVALDTPQQAVVVGQRVEATALHRDGRTLAVEVAVTVLTIDRAPHFTAFITDISARKAAEEEIRLQALLDPLTGLPNRRALTSQLQRASAASMRHGQQGALLFIDLDKFKAVNDTLGHAAGDQLLQQVALRLREATRTADTSARLGGDEFVVMLENLDVDPAKAQSLAEMIAEKLIRRLNQDYLLNGQPAHCTPSIGLALFPRDGADPDTLMRRADRAMYRAKAAGRNTVCVAQAED